MYNTIFLNPILVHRCCHQVGLVLTAPLAVIRLGKAGVREGGGRCPSSMGTWRGTGSPSSRGGSMRARVGEVS